MCIRDRSHIDVLTDIRSEVDAVFLQDYKDLSLLFEDKKNGKVTPFRSFFISYLDMEETDWKLQLQRLRTVSYTHLDVYKRQPVDGRPFCQSC